MAKKRPKNYVVVINERVLVTDLVDELLALHDESPLYPVSLTIPDLPEGIVYDDQEDGSQKSVVFGIAERVLLCCGEDKYTYNVGCTKKRWWVEIIPTGQVAQELFHQAQRFNGVRTEFVGTLR